MLPEKVTLRWVLEGYQEFISHKGIENIFNGRNRERVGNKEKEESGEIKKRVEREKTEWEEQDETGRQSSRGMWS